MDHRLEQAKEKIHQAIEEISMRGIENPETICNMEKLVKSAHYIAEIEMLEEITPDDYAKGYSRYYDSGRNRGGNRGGTYNRNRDRDYGGGDDVRMYLEESLRNAKSDHERERIRRMMNEYN